MGVAEEENYGKEDNIEVNRIHKDTEKKKTMDHYPDGLNSVDYSNYSEDNNNYR